MLVSIESPLGVDGAGVMVINYLMSQKLGAGVPHSNPQWRNWINTKLSNSVQTAYWTL